MAKYRVTCNWVLEKDDGTTMNTIAGVWENLEYEDVVNFEGTMMAQVAIGFHELNKQEIEKKKKDK